jgi:hypothetical protein
MVVVRSTGSGAGTDELLVVVVVRSVVTGRVVVHAASNGSMAMRVTMPFFMISSS